MDRLFVRRYDGINETQVITAHFTRPTTTIQQRITNAKFQFTGFWWRIAGQNGANSCPCWFSYSLFSMPRPVFRHEKKTSLSLLWQGKLTSQLPNNNFNLMASIYLKVACNRCSSHKLPLPYDGTKALRVCDACHQSITSFTNQQSANSHPNSQIPESPASSPELTPSPPSLRTGLLEVNVETPSVMAGYLSLKTRGKTWQRRWFALRSDFVLYSYRSDQGEHRAVTATPVPGFSVSLISGSNSLLSDGSSPSQIHLPIGKTNSISSTNGSVVIATDNNGMISERDRSFKMAHVHKSYHFQAATRQEAEK